MLTTAGSNTFTYDNAGQQTTRSGPGLDQTITWTQTGMPATLTDGTDVTGFYYTADNTRLIREDSNGSLTITLGDWYETDITGGGTTETDHYTFAGQSIGFAVDGTTTETWFAFTDQLNTNSVFYNHTQNGAITRQWFDPWGQPRANTGTSPSELGYTGQRSDPTSLMDYGARLYDPAHATFISPDTIIPDPTSPGDLNRYSYVRNNPATMNDPSGNCPFLVAAVGGPVGALAAGTACLGWLVGGALVTTAFVVSEVADHGSPGFLSAPNPARSSTDLPATTHHSGSPGFTATDSWANGIPGFTTRGRPSPTVTVLPSLDPADQILILLAVELSDKILGQMEERGWTPELIEEVVNNPSTVHSVWDGRVGKNHPATAYARSDSFYVVVNDVTNEVVQISNRNRPQWKPVWKSPKFSPR